MVYYKITKSQPLSLKEKIIKECKASWWVVLFACFTYMLSIKTLHAKDLEIVKLAKQLKQLEFGREHAAQIKRSLSLQIESQQDPLWVEKLLLRKLGLVPEGYTKVRFNKEELVVQHDIDG